MGIRDNLLNLQRILNYQGYKKGEFHDFVKKT
jgi:hypothetical protein